MHLRPLYILLFTLLLATPVAAQPFATPDWEQQDPTSMADASRMAGSMMPVSFSGGGTAVLIPNAIAIARLATFSGGVETLPSLNTVFALLVLLMVVSTLVWLHHLATIDDIIQPQPIPRALPLTSGTP